MKHRYITDEQITARILQIMFEENDVHRARKQMWEWIKIGKINFNLFCNILSAIEERSYDGPKL